MLDNMPERLSLPNQSPVRVKRPINEQTATDQVYVWNRSPVAAVKAVITVIAHGEIPVARNDIFLVRPRQIIMTGRIPAIRRSRRRDPLKPVSFPCFAVAQPKRRILA